MREYNPKEIESKWQAEWERSGVYSARDKKLFGNKPKWYSLIEFPYPSGDGLHVGHPRPYIGMDVVSRKRRMQGYNVLYPIGWDAFGLPTENYAIKTGKDPRQVTKENTDTFRRQIKSLGVSFDWAREINTTDPKYYKWTQWLFLKFLEKGLAYKARIPINWCPKDKIGLANEEVVDGRCERCGTPVEQKDKEQWMLKITAYADRLYDDLETVDYPERVKAQQRNWIGKSEGALIKFDDIEVFTTRPDTIYGATFLVKAGKQDRFTGEYVTNPATKEKIPVWEAEYVYADYGTGAIMGVPAHDERDFEFARKHDLPVKQVIEPVIVRTEGEDAIRSETEFAERNAVVCVIKHWSENKYLCLAWKKTPWKGFVIGGIEEGEKVEEAALREVREETGYRNLRPVRVLPTVHSKFYQPVKKVNRLAHFHPVYIELIDEQQEGVNQEEKDLHDLIWLPEEEVASFLNRDDMAIIWRSFQGELQHSSHGILINSANFSGADSEKVQKDITRVVGGDWVTKFKLRDWVFSRQRYWGEPIPVVHCDKCGMVPVPEKDLPVELPVVEKYEPGPDGESPLSNISEWVNTKCPKCGGDAKRETDVMPNWAGSSWYFLRYADHDNDKEFASKSALKHWMPVDWYNGGMEHTTLHLLYSRFWNKFLFDIGLVPTSEPYMKRTSHGLILAEGGKKMSKSLGNVVNPDSIVDRLGADTLRVYEMFMGPFEQAIAWNDDSLVGPRRFLEKVWRLRDKVSEAKPDEYLLHTTIKKVSDDIEVLGFNTAISAMMVWVNELEKRDAISKEEYETLLQLLAPFAPHITEELWHELGHSNSIHTENWPKFDKAKLVKSEVVIAIQVNGKVRGSITVSSSATNDEVQKQAISNPEIGKWIKDKEVAKVIVIPQKIVNIVVK